MTVEEILAALATEVGTDKAKAKDVAKQLRATVPALGQELLNTGAAIAKRDSTTATATLTKERDDALADAQALRTEFDEFKTKTPDAAAIETRAAEKYGKRIKTLEESAAAKDQKVKGALARVTRERLIAQLIAGGTDPDYAREVLGARHADRIVVDDEGAVRVLQLGGADPYDADTEDAAVVLLAADVGKTVPAKFVLTNADSGGGTGGRNGGTTGFTEAQLAERKRATGMYRGVV